MLLLTSTSDKLQVITGSTGTVEVHTSWVDNLSGAITPGRTNTPTISSATTTDVVAAPGASTQRNVKFISVRNDHATTSNLVQVQHTDGTNVITLWVGTLLAQESINFNEGVGWQYLDASGNPKLAATKLDVWLQVTANVVNATTSFADITGLTAAVVSGKKYMFEAHLGYTNNAASTAAQFAINGPTMTSVTIRAIQNITASVTGAAIATGFATALDTAATLPTTGSTTQVPVILSGMFQPSAAGTVALRVKSTVAVAAGATVVAGSWVHIRELDN